MSDIQEFAEQLSSTRKSKGLSQADLAQMLGMKQSQISDIESGKRNIRVGTLLDVGRAIGLELVLVPRSFLPAVSHIIDPKMQNSTSQEQHAKYEIWNEDDL